MVLGKQGRNYVDASKGGVGEIDTSSPFESVKHAVSLFGAVAFTRKRTQLSGSRPRTHQSEKLSAKESRLHLAEKELNKLKENLRSTDVTRTLALSELEKSKKTLEKLNEELSVFSKSKEAVFRETEPSDNVWEKSSSNIFDRTLSSCRRELDTLTAQYLAAALKLNEAKKELGNLRQDYDSASRSFNDGLRQSSEAKAASKANNEAAIELSEKISGAKKLIQQVKLASVQAVEEKLQIEASRENARNEYRIKLDVSAKSCESLKKELDPDTTGRIRKQLESTYDQSESLKQDIRKAKDSYSELATMLGLELDNEKAMLQNILDEENSLLRLIESLKLELECTKKELFEMNGREANTRHLADDLEAELQKNTLELENCMTGESKVRNTFVEMKATLVDLMTWSQWARQEAKYITLESEAVMKQAEADRNSIKEYEAKLLLLVQEIEAARSAEAEALQRVKLLSEHKDSGAKITLSIKELYSLNVKVNDSSKLPDIKVSIVKAVQNDSLEKLVARQKELEELKLATAAALKMATEAEADKITSEGELERLDQSLLNKAEGVPSSKIHCEIVMEKLLSFPNAIGKSHSTSSARRRRVTLGDFLKMDWEGKEQSKRAHMRSLSGLFRGM